MSINIDCYFVDAVYFMQELLIATNSNNNKSIIIINNSRIRISISSNNKNNNRNGNSDKTTINAEVTNKCTATLTNSDEDIN